MQLARPLVSHRLKKGGPYCLENELEALVVIDHRPKGLGTAREFVYGVSGS
jgi:hypothetical protein